MLKKALLLLIAAAIVLSLPACSGSSASQFTPQLTPMEETPIEEAVTASSPSPPPEADTPTPEPPTDTPPPPTDTATPLPPTDTPVPPTPTPAPTDTPTPEPSPISISEASGNDPLPSSPTPEATPTNTQVPLDAPVSLGMCLWDVLGEENCTVINSENPNAGVVYEEGLFVYGEVIVQIGDATYRIDRQNRNPDAPEQHLPGPYSLEIAFPADMLVRVEGEPGYDPRSGEFWIGKLKCDSQRGADTPYTLTVRVLTGDEVKAKQDFYFGVLDSPTCQ